MAAGVTLQYLINSTRDFKPILFQNATNCQLTDFDIVDYEGTNTKVFTGVSRDPTVASHEGRAGRKVIMAFVQDELDKHIPLDQWRPSISNSRVLVYSASPFFKYAAQYPLKQVGGLYGAIRKFVVKGTGRSPNPRQVPFLPKHLLAFARRLQQQGYIE